MTKATCAGCATGSRTPCSLAWLFGGFLLLVPIAVVIGEILFDWRQVELPRDLVWVVCAPIGALLFRAADSME